MTAPKSNAERLRVLAQLLALADERRSISLMDAADEIGVPARTLRELLEPVLYLEWRDADGELMGETRAFLLTEDDELLVTEEHWLRGIASTKPDPATALRLFVAGTVVQAATREPLPTLDRALDRLEGILEADVVVNFDRPRWTDFLEDANRNGRRVHMRYLSAIGGTARDLEVEPHLIASRWGNWYLFARISEGDRGPEWDDAELSDRDRLIPFRVDRILDARLADASFTPEAVEVPDWWDMSAHERALIVRAGARDLQRIPEPARTTVVRELGDGRVEAEIVVIGPLRLEQLLLLLGPDAEIVWPEEMVKTRTESARRVLEAYQ